MLGYPRMPLPPPPPGARRLTTQLTDPQFCVNKGAHPLFYNP